MASISWKMPKRVRQPIMNINLVSDSDDGWMVITKVLVPGFLLAER